MVETTIQPILAGTVSGRCYPLVAPDNPTKPYIVYQVVSKVPEVTLESTEARERCRIQIDAYATTYAEVKTLEASIKAALVNISVPLLAFDQFEADTKLFRVTLEHSIWS